MPARLTKTYSLVCLLFLLSACGTASRHPAPPLIKEPEIYQATILYSYLPGNNRDLQPNELFKLDVARRGADRQYVFNFGHRTLSYLEGAERHYLIAPQCREYTDATLEDMNFRIPGALAPEQLVTSLAGARDLQYVGEERFDGRTAARYSAPDDKMIYVDQATGLPLRVEVKTEVAAPSKGFLPTETKGVLNVIVAVRDIRTELEANAFQLPPDMREVEQAALCADANQLAESAMQLLWSISDKGQSER